MISPLRCDQVAHDTWLIHGSPAGVVHQVTVNAETATFEFRSYVECYTCGTERLHTSRVSIHLPEQIAQLEVVVGRARELFCQLYSDALVKESMGGSGAR